MSDIPLAEWKNALDILIQQWSPFKETGRYIVSGTGYEAEPRNQIEPRNQFEPHNQPREIAQVWIGDEAERFIAMKDAGKNISRIFPETILYPPPETDTLRLVICVEGIEAQIWKEGILIASHHWKRDISPKEWVKFLLANDMNPSIQIPEPEAVQMLNQPWGKSSDNYSQFKIPKAAFQMITGVLIFFLIWQSVGIWRWHQGEKILNEQISLLTQEAEPLLNARSRAISCKDNADKLLSLNAYPPQLNMMAAIADNLSQNIRLAEWHYNQGRVAFTLKGIHSEQGKDLDPRYYVETYQKLPYFKEVSAEKGVSPDELVVKMECTP